MSRIRMAAPRALLVLAQQLPTQRQETRQPESMKTAVPIKTVMLFSSGVGYFEHAGMVNGNSATELRFKTAQINDILKSLVLRDDDGGKISSITYIGQSNDYNKRLLTKLDEQESSLRNCRSRTTT